MIDGACAATHDRGSRCATRSSTSFSNGRRPWPSWLRRQRPKSTVAHHVNVLVDAGMLRVVRTRRVAQSTSGYGRTARCFSVGVVDRPGEDPTTVHAKRPVRWPAAESAQHEADRLPILRHARIPGGACAEFWERVVDADPRVRPDLALATPCTASQPVSIRPTSRPCPTRTTRTSAPELLSRASRRSRSGRSCPESLWPAASVSKTGRCEARAEERRRIRVHDLPQAAGSPSCRACGGSVAEVDRPAG